MPAIAISKKAMNLKQSRDDIQEGVEKEKGNEKWFNEIMISKIRQKAIQKDYRT